MAKRKIRVDVFVGLDHDTEPAYRNSYRFEIRDAESEIDNIVHKLLDDISDLWNEVETDGEDEEGE